MFGAEISCSGKRGLLLWYFDRHLVRGRPSLVKGKPSQMGKKKCMFWTKQMGAF